VNTLRTVSYGGGVQSTALLVLAAQRELDFPLFLFANVGHDSEHPDTLAYVEQIATPYAKANGIELVTLQQTIHGEPDTLLQRIHRTKKSIPIPVRRSGGKPFSRTCTVDFKIRVTAKEVRRRGATKDNPAITALGFSLDEIHRMSNNTEPYRQLVYPLVDLRLTRQDCINVIARAGIAVPPPSACYFCPFHSPTAWRRLKTTRPDLFQKAVDLERYLTDRQRTLGREPVYMMDALQPLDQAIAGDWYELYDSCASGYCFT